MRFWIALTLFVGGLVSASLGLWNQLQNAPLDRITSVANLEAPTTYLYLPSSLLSAYQAPVSVEALGPKVLIAQARDGDILGWLGDSPYVELRLTINSNEQRAELLEIPRGEQGALADPTGSDMWRAEVVGEESASITPPLDGETGLLIASNGIEGAPRSLSITWDLTDQPVTIAPITLIGISLMVIGAVMALIEAIIYRRKYRRRRIGPRPPRRRAPRRAVSQAGAPRRGRRAQTLSFAASVLSVSMLSGCVPEYENPLLSPSPIAAPETLTPAVTKEQAEKILREIVAVVEKSDETLNRESLEVRVSGPALQVRRFDYNLVRRFTETERLPQPIQSSPVQLFLPPATDTWPRSIVMVTGEENLQLLVLRQESAREKYNLYLYANLLPDISFPEVASELIGANQLKPDNKFLKVSPDVLVEAVGDLLNQGADSTWSLVMDPENAYIQDVSSVQRSLTETLTNANLDFAHELAADEPVMLTTVDGGALVALYMIDTYTIIPKRPGDAVAISGDEAILLGSGGSATGIEARYGAMLIFHVPAAGSENRVSLLGATQQLLTAIALGQ
jgi:hypothetical protein